MVVLQIPLLGYDANGRISARVACNFIGRHRVKFLNYAMNWSINNATTEQILLIDSRELLTNFPRNQILIVTGTGRVASISEPFEFECDKLTGVINVDVCLLDGTPPANFSNGLLNFDFQRVDEKL